MAALLVRSPTSVRELAIRRERAGASKGDTRDDHSLQIGKSAQNRASRAGTVPPATLAAPSPGLLTRGRGVLRGARSGGSPPNCSERFGQHVACEQQGSANRSESAVSVARCGPIADRRSPARTSAWPPPLGSIGRKFGAVQVARRSLIVPWWDRTERAKGQRQLRRNATSGTNPRLHHSTRLSLSTSNRFSQKRARRTSVALPQYVERELRAYLKCGILAHGFLRARCRSCSKDLLVALSCKKRGVCPSCNARRMCGTAAHLTDEVMPEVPLRPWVLSVPFELRLLLARDPRALTAVGRIFMQEIFRSQRERAGLSGLRSTASGAVCFPQRFGGSMNLNVHFHVVVPTACSQRPGAPLAPTFGDRQHRTVWISKRSQLTSRCESWDGYVATGFSITTQTSHRPNPLLAQRSMPACRAHSAWAS